MIDPKKYVTFYREDYERCIAKDQAYQMQEIPDAVVILKRDQFAHLCLNAYANAAVAAAEILQDVLGGEPSAGLIEIADFMAGEALHSRTMQSHIPDP